MRNKSNKSIFAVLLLLFCGFLFTLEALSDDAIRTVRAGYFAFPGYHKLDGGGRSGYGYDFLSLLQRYSHLKCDYVGYENSWEEMQQMLLDGKIDLVTSARKTIEREKYFDFSMPIGLNSAQLNVRKDDERFIPGNYAALDGITIGILSGNSRNADTEIFAKEKGFSYKAIEYSNVVELQHALLEGKVDAIATSSLRKSNDEKTIAEFAPEKFYVIVKKGNTELLNEINYAIDQMDLNEGNWRDDLYYKNYETNTAKTLAFTQRELDYIKKVKDGEKKITAIAKPNRAPYSFVKDGKLVGIIPDYFSRLMAMAGLPYEMLVAKDVAEYQKWIETNYADVIIDCPYNTPGSSAAGRGMHTNPYMELTLSRVTRKGVSETPKVIATSDLTAENVIKQEYGNNVEYVTVKSPEDALELVQDGKADACYVYTYTAEAFINKDFDSNLVYTILKNPVYNACISTSFNTDHELCSILNKCITSDATSILSEYVSKYTLVPFDNLSFAQYLKLHLQYVFLIVAIFVLGLALIIVLVAKSRAAKLQAEQLEKELKTADELNANRIVIESLSEDFGCVNYVELTADKNNDIGVNYRISNILKRLIPGWENEKNFTRKLHLLNENFIYEQDRAQFLEDTNRDNVIAKLQDSDTYYINARGVLDGEIKYYQMKFTAVRKDGELAGVVAGLHSVDDAVRSELAAKEQLKDALATAKEEQLRNNIIHEIIHSGKWSFFVDAKDNITRAEYSDDVQRVIGNDLAAENYAWTEILHPDDKEQALAAFNATIADHTCNTPYDVTYRMIDRNGVYHWFHSAGRIVRDENGDGEFFGVHIDITDQIEEQQKRVLGAVPLSPDILGKANIGLWAFELDEGQPPRMYVDDTMLGLIGLDHQVSPEETYHAWYDHIDEGSYGIVKDAVAKMMSGEHAEVQYPWHHPNGTTMIVRCGGVPNPEYTKGIRVEGTHQNVTEVLHFDEEEVERLKKTEVQLRHEQLRSEVLNYMIDNNDDPIELLKKFAERLRVLINCDQVIYRDLEETRIMVNSPAIEKTWSVPIEYCQQCQHFDAHHPMYAGGYTEMDNCQEGWQGIPVYHDCPIKSSLTRIVYCDGEIAGYLAIHYVQNYHHFIDVERSTLEEFTRILSMSLSRYKATKENKELKLLQEYQKELQKNLEIIEALTADYSSVYYVDIDSERVTPYSMNEETKHVMAKTFENNVLFPDAFKAYVEQFVYEPDKEMLMREGRKQIVLGKLAENNSYSITFRGLSEGVVTFCEMKYVVAHKENGEIKSVGLGFAYKDNEIMAQYINEKLVAEYISAFMVDLDKDKFRIYRHPSTTSALDREDRTWSLAMADFATECDPEYTELIKNIGSPDFLKQELADADRREYLYRAPTTSKPWRRAVIQVIDRKDGVPSNVVATFMEIDDYQSKINDQQKQLEEQQHQLQEALAMAQSANRAKTTFLNSMSHDIRTPMNAIIGFTGLAASHIDNKEQVQDYLGKIGQSSNHLLSLINDVLDMSRIESGKMNLDEKPENLPAIIHTLHDIVLADIHQKQHDFFIDTVNVYDENIICDKLRLNQVLLNILSNSIKYTAQGGTISMRITEKTVKPSGYATYEFCIKDNGMGMDQEYLKTIFDPFTRVKSSTVSGIQGTGLGMAITKNIIDMMGGKIDVQSEPGKGTQMTVTFDFKLQTEHRNETTNIPELKGLRGLVADDDANTCLSIYAMLKEIGMRAEWCTTGKEAIFRAEAAYRESDLFKVYIIDWLMPDMNGIETTRRIRKVIGDDVPIIILTAYDWSDIVDEAREAGVTAFVSKPMFPSDLQRVLNNCLGKTEVVSEKASDNYDFKGKKILLVEDNELNREIATELLTEYGIVIDTAEDGTVAVEKMKQAKDGDYDLVLMDIQMPIMNGYDATKAIRALGTPISKIPILAMTADAFEEDRKKAIDAGMNEHVTKPINVDKLREALGKFL